STSYCHPSASDLHSFPTRRSSDLAHKSHTHDIPGGPIPLGGQAHNYSHQTEWPLQFHTCPAPLTHMLRIKLLVAVQHLLDTVLLTHPAQGRLYLFLSLLRVSQYCFTSISDGLGIADWT